MSRPKEFTREKLKSIEKMGRKGMLRYKGETTPLKMLRKHWPEPRWREKDF